MFSPPAWLLPLVLFATWFLWIFAAVAEKRAGEIRSGVSPERYGGVSILPGFPIMPLLFWGAAWLVDRFVYPWGSVVLGGFHLIFALLMAATFLRDLRFCRLNDPHA